MSLPVDLFFTQTIDCHCDEESGHDPDCDFANECEALGLMSPKRKCSQSPNPDHFDHMDEEEEEEGHGSATRVRFHDFMKVVLIPTKEEFKRANCDLWWKRMDFVSFQKSASSELRLFSMMQGIDVHQAKHLLYQPTSGDRESSSTTAYDIHQMMEEFHEDPFYDPNQSHQIFRQRTESEESVEEKKQQPEAEDEEKKIEADSLPNPNQLTETSETSSVSPHPSQITATAAASPSSDRPPAIVPPSEAHEPLNFCVPISDPVPASNNSRMSKYRNTIASAGILAAMGLFSFAAPILGFYFLSSQR